VSEQNKETSGADEGRLDATTVMEEPDGHLVRVVALNMVDWIQTSIVVDSTEAGECIVVWIPQCSYTQGAVSEAFLEVIIRAVVGVTPWEAPCVCSRCLVFLSTCREDMATSSFSPPRGGRRVTIHPMF